jgi:hypothetical protein
MIMLNVKLKPITADLDWLCIGFVHFSASWVTTDGSSCIRGGALRMVRFYLSDKRGHGESLDLCRMKSI